MEKIRLPRVTYGLWLLPIIALYFPLSALQSTRMGGQGDYFGYVFLARIQAEHPTGLPSTLANLNFPVGEALTEMPETFSEPLVRNVLGWLARIAGDPVEGMFWALILASMLNIGLVWLIFWKKYSQKSLLAVFVGWSIVALLPWWWVRSYGHWHLSVLPLLLLACGVWTDFFVEGKLPSKRWLWGVAVLQCLLFAQSVYYGAFLVIFGGGWSLAYAPRLARDGEFRKRWYWLVGLSAVGCLADLAWVIQQYGGVEAWTQTLASGQRSLMMIYNYSNRIRNLVRGADGSPSGWIALQISTRSHGVDGEGFPAPLPKVALALCAFAVWRRSEFRARLKNPVSRTRRAAVFCAVTFLIMLLTGMQEITWIKFNILYPVFPFIRSYSRMFVVLMMVVALGFAHFAADFEAFARSKWSGARLSRVMLGGAAVWLVALLFDYGFQWNHNLVAEVPCAGAYEVVKKERHPIFFSGDVTEGYCLADYRRFYAITGAPIVQKTIEMPAIRFPAGSEGCAQVRERIRAAQKASAGVVWWWFSGAEAEWASEDQCLAQASRTQVFEERSPDGTLNRMVRLGSLP